MISLDSRVGTQADQVSGEYCCVSLCGQGDALRNELLSRYYGKAPGHSVKSTAANGTHSSVAETERGLVMLSRAHMTLHDVQVDHFSVQILWQYRTFHLAVDCLVICVTFSGFVTLFFCQKLDVNSAAKKRPVNPSHACVHDDQTPSPNHNVTFG